MFKILNIDSMNTFLIFKKQKSVDNYFILSF